MRSNKPSVWMDAGIHAREWISPATSLFIINELLNNYSLNSNVTRWIDEIDFYFLPVMNPDGYEYTWETNRLWRKNRRPIIIKDNNCFCFGNFCFCKECNGVDLNRNFNLFWAENTTDGHSTCSESYYGQYPFSEPETNSVANFLYQRREKIKLYLSLHSYSQLMLLPFGNKMKPHDFQEIYDLGKQAIDAATRIHGSYYRIGNSADILYVATGLSTDWAKGVAGIKYAFTIELRDRGDYGFRLPADQIIPTGQEIWAAFKVLSNKIYESI